MIVDSRGPLNGTQIGPMLEGDNLVLNCRVLGGKSLISFRETPFILCHFVISISFFLPKIRSRENLHRMSIFLSFFVRLQFPKLIYLKLELPRYTTTNNILLCNYTEINGSIKYKCLSSVKLNDAIQRNLLSDKNN